MVYWKKFNKRCPKCDSENLEYFSYEPVDEQIKQDVFCNNCELDFVIWSKLNWEVDGDVDV